MMLEFLNYLVTAAKNAANHADLPPPEITLDSPTRRDAEIFLSHVRLACRQYGMELSVPQTAQLSGFTLMGVKVHVR